MTPPSALITGGSRGIGYGIAGHLAARGWNLTLCARDAERLATVRTELSALGAAIETVATDLADDAAADAAVTAHTAAYGHLNALILAAGIGSSAPLAGYPMRRFDKQLAVNLRSPFAFLASALPHLRAGAAALPEHGGRVVALASLEGVHPEQGLAAYGASKAALISLVRSVNAEESAHGITASAISPGYVDTDMSAWVSCTIPTGSMITVEDVVKAVDLVLTVSRNAVLPHLVINRVAAGAHQP